MIAEKLVDLYARDSGLRDKLIAERDVVLTYALRALVDAGLARQLAFKGGTYLRKIAFGSAGRFSEDLDFTLCSDRPPDDVLVEVVELFNRTHYGISFKLGDYYKTEDEDSFGGDVQYRHDWNAHGRFRLQISLRERPTLPPTPSLLKPQPYAPHLEFSAFAVPSLQLIEVVAEKVRAAYQRAKVRDLHDLHRCAALPLDIELLRRLVVLKLWQARDAFDADRFYQQLRGEQYDWDDLWRLVRPAARVEPASIIAALHRRYEPLRALTELEIQVVADARSGSNQPLADRLRAEIRELASADRR